MKVSQLPPPLESVIQKAILDYLILYVSPNFGFFNRIQSSGLMVQGRNGKKDKMIPSRGMIGIADIIGCYRGHYVALEVKRPKLGHLSENQRAWGAKVEKAGGRYFVVTGIDDVKSALETIDHAVRLSK